MATLVERIDRPSKRGRSQEGTDYLGTSGMARCLHAGRLDISKMRLVEDSWWRIELAAPQTIDVQEWPHRDTKQTLLVASNQDAVGIFWEGILQLYPSLLWRGARPFHRCPVCPVPLATLRVPSD